MRLVKSFKKGKKMLQFILGVLIGGIVGFAVCAVCKMASSAEYTDDLCQEESGDTDDRK